MRPDPLFEAFDAGWVLLIVAAACALAYALVWLGSDGPPASEIEADPVEHDTTADRHSPEDDARRSPF